MADKRKSRKIKLELDLGDLLDQVMVLGSSAVYLAKDGADRLVKELEDRELLSSDEGKKMAEKIKDRLSERRERVSKVVKKNLRKLMDELEIGRTGK